MEKENKLFLTFLHRRYVNPASLATNCFLPSSFSVRAANNISHPAHIATQQIKADKTWNCCFDCGSNSHHFPAHSLLPLRGREVQPASVFRFVAPVIKSASLFFSFLSSVWEPEQQKGAALCISAHISPPMTYTMQELLNVVFFFLPRNHLRTKHRVEYVENVAGV